VGNGEGGEGEVVFVFEVVPLRDDDDGAGEAVFMVRRLSSRSAALSTVHGR
jgi:hypothetical protein